MTKELAHWSYKPGIDGNDSAGFTIRLGEGLGVHEFIEYADCLYPEDGQQYVEAEANARLIVNAPETAQQRDEMMEVLEAWLAWDGEIRGTPSPPMLARAAIGRAKGLTA